MYDGAGYYSCCRIATEKFFKNYDLRTRKNGPITMISAHDPENRNHSPNRLISEKSPYLLQHAYNPVNWYPWGPEAFEAAQKENKPVFLSIGYSACHWCHVMEKESFEDNEVAGSDKRSVHTR